jgi:hypothetical protein
MKTTAIICSLMLLVSMTTSGQTREEFEQERNRLRNEMSNYIDQTRKEFNEYLDRINKEYSDYLRKNWKPFQVLQALEPDSTPKPRSLPKYNPGIDKMRPGEPVNVISGLTPAINPGKIPQEPLLPVLLPEDEPLESPQTGDEQPEDQSGENPLFPDTGNGPDFYGQQLFIVFDPAMKGGLPSEINNAAIAGFWDRMNKTDYALLVRRLSDLRNSMNLGDWGYYQLVKKSSEYINPDTNYSRLLTWFLMTKSGYKTRIAYYDNRIAILFPSVNKIYGLHYFLIGNVKYYAPDFLTNQIFTYEKDFPGATKVLDLNLFSAPNLGNTYESKTIVFNHNDREYSVNVEYNSEVIKFYNEFPLCELKLYFDAAVSARTKESLLYAFQPILDGLSETDAINLLLAFVQKGFVYKTDPEQFNGREKFFFPEETLFYPYSDCDDRAVLFAFLVRELTGLKVIGLAYPGHVATAVNFTGETNGDYVMYKDEKYIVADPTYISAPAGLTMPGMKNSVAGIIDLQSMQNDKEIIASIWEKTEENGGYMGENFQTFDRDSDGNYYIAGYYKGKLTIGGTTLSSNPANKDAFIARFNKHGNPEWAISGGSEGNAMATNIRLDKENNIYIAGTFEKSINFGGIMTFANANANTFIAKLNPDGKLVWMNQRALDTSDIREGIHVLSLTGSGQIIKVSKYPQDPNFSAYGISFDDKKNVYYTASFNYLTGLVDKLTLAAESTLNVPAILKEESDRQIQEKCDRSVAGLFSALMLLRNGTVTISGKTVQAAFEQYNPEFKKRSPQLFESIGKITMMKNDQGIITITTEDQKPIGLDRMKINHNTRMKLSLLANGDARIDILGGVKVGKSIIWFNLNYIRLFRTNGAMLFDYDSDHSQVTINVKKDLL